jgi:autotransporter-associated beta strand protein
VDLSLATTFEPQSTPRRNPGQDCAIQAEQLTITNNNQNHAMKERMHITIGCLKSPLRLFQGVAAGVSLLAALSSAQAQFTTLPIYDPFGQYDENSGLGANNTTSTSNYWNQGNSVGSSNPRVLAASALAYPALVSDTNTVPKGVRSAISTGSRDAGALFTPRAGTIYASFLINNINNQGTTFDRMFFSLQTGTSMSGGFGMAAYLTPDLRIKIRKNPSGSPSGAFSAATPVLSTNVAHLVVIAYRTNSVAGAPGEVALWLDPMPFGDDASIPPPTLSTTNGANVNSFQAIALTSRGAGIYTFNMDEIRLGDTWASVTPLATPLPGPTFTVTGGGIGCAGDTFPINLSGSVTTNDYLLYTNAAYAGVTLTGTGASLNFGSFDAVATYSVLASNNVNGNIGWMSNSPSIYVRASVNIVTQPASVTVATNNRAEFNVSATGDELAYRWHKGGSPLSDDSHITGSSTPKLVVWPATAADAGSYTCVVTNVCSITPSTSDPATLTLDGVDELVWAGNAFLNIWDVGNASYPYFTDTNLNPVVFNPGDAVTFNDSSINADTIALTNILTPTRLTIDASRNYIFQGSGTIAGDCALVKTGAGVLVLNNNPGNGGMNTFTGGTIISNGVVNITNSWYGLGSGLVTLAGGTLQNWQKGNAGGPGAEQGLSNNVSVTANSVWQLDRTGDQAAALLGSLNGNVGTTLTFYHSATNQNSVNRVRIAGLFTNSLAIVASANPLATNSPLDIGTYNATGAQVYNGPISGENTGFLVVGAGEAYLNAANTYTRDTTTFVGFLAGSGSINGRLVVNAGTTIGGGSQAGIGTFTVNSNVVLNGNVRIRVNKSLVQSNDLISATGSIANGGVGTVTITNIGATPLAVGDSFKIFSGAVSNGAALVVTGGAVSWVNNLSVDGSIQVAPSIANYPTNISYSLSGGTLNISWPGTHLGWILQSQTNALGVGLTTNWHDVSGTAGVTNQSASLDPANPTVFYRLRYP